MTNFEFKKSLGQNFLKDDNIPNKIANCAEIDKDTLVIEIGPGAGSLSKKIIPLSKYTILYEIDTRLKDILESELSQFNNYKIIFNDVLKVDISSELKNYQYKKLYVVANLPYYITTPIINKLINEIYPDKIVIMIQEEVADRLASKCGNREYGMISALIQSEYDVKKKFKVGRNNFIPVPNVDSAVISLEKKNIELDADHDKFEQLLKDSFQFKRKNLRNNLKKYDLQIIESVLNKYNLSLQNRAEDVSPEIFMEITKSI